MGDPGGWRWDEPASAELADLLSQAYPPHDAELLARRVSPSLAGVVDFRGGSARVWAGLLDAATRADQEIIFLEKVLVDSTKASVHPAVLAWMERPQPSARRLRAVPDPLPEAAEPETAESVDLPRSLIAAVQRFAYEVARLGRAPTVLAMQRARLRLRAPLDEIDDRLESWRREILVTSSLGYDRQWELLRLLDRLAAAWACAAQALSHLWAGRPPAPAMETLAGAAETLSAVLDRPG